MEGYEKWRIHMACPIKSYGSKNHGKQVGKKKLIAA
jgi:hypothetical protein